MSRRRKKAYERAYEIGRDVPLEMPHNGRDNDDAVSQENWAIRAVEILDPPCRHLILETTKPLSQMVASTPVTASETLIKCQSLCETLQINRVEGKGGFSYFYKYRCYDILQEWSVNNRYDSGNGCLTVQHHQISSQSSAGQKTVVSPYSAVSLVSVHSELQA